jgi:hypothetical protein
MSVRLDRDSIILSGTCSVDDAEPLLALLRDNPGCAVDLGGAHHLHAAVLQVLLANPRDLAGPAGDAFLQGWIVPHLASNRKTSAV